MTCQACLERQSLYAVPQLRIPIPLPGAAPDTLEEAILLCEPVEAIVALAHGADEAAQGVNLVVASVAAVLVNLANADLDRSVVLGLDDASGGRLRGVSIAVRALTESFECTHAFAGDENCMMLDLILKTEDSRNWWGAISCCAAHECERTGHHLRSTSSPRSFSIFIDV